MSAYSSQVFAATAGCVAFALALGVIPFAGSATESDTQRIHQTVKAIAATLPPGWAIAEEKAGEIPYGHHWDESYSGPTGTLLVLKGTQPVYAEFADATGKWQRERVAVEGLRIWLMPSDYSNSRLAALAIHRPVQPTTVVGHGPVKVYAAPWPVLVSEKGFEIKLQKASGMRWADPQVDSPGFLTWKDWRLKVRRAVEREMTKQSPES